MGAAAYRCTECGAELALDQRYCVECGTRRGQPRFTMARSQASQPAPASAPGGFTSRVNAALAIVVVLVALGIGVLIGSSFPGPVRVVASGGAALTSGSSSTGGQSGKTGGAGSSSSSSSNPNSCKAGTPGCKHGKQTTNFFGS